MSTELCSDCASIQTHTRTEFRHTVLAHHKHLAEKGVEAMNYYGQRGVNVYKYRCDVCGKNWKYEDDSNDPNSGWS